MTNTDVDYTQAPEDDSLRLFATGTHADSMRRKKELRTRRESSVSVYQRGATVGAVEAKSPNPAIEQDTHGVKAKETQGGPESDPESPRRLSRTRVHFAVLYIEYTIYTIIYYMYVCIYTIIRLLGCVRNVVYSFVRRCSLRHTSSGFGILSISPSFLFPTILIFISFLPPRIGDFIMLSLFFFFYLRLPSFFHQVK